jgi:hypothetical protein
LISTRSPHVTLKDDRGTVYRSARGSATGYSKQVLHGESVFRPAVPETATELVVQSAGGSVSVTL